MSRRAISRNIRGATGLFLLFLFGVRAGVSDPRCATCHPKEVAGYAASAMSRSLAKVGSVGDPPEGSFEHAFSKTTFVIRGTGVKQTQGFSRATESSEHPSAFVIGSGEHAFGYLVAVGDHVFQSPLSYYTKKKVWDVAPGYEMDRHPDFSRPITVECLTCHSGKPLPISGSINRYQSGVFASYGISCERCHGSIEAHLKNPASGSILNPRKLTGAARASICEQCHLIGVARIANPGGAISDFVPGRTLEDFYTTYVASAASGESVKVVSHVEQLALSRCSRESTGKLWCGTCHNPHEQPVERPAYFRERCLSCHAATLGKEHAAAGRDCVGCHMRQLPAKDGGHTAFTDHRISLPGTSVSGNGLAGELAAWREPTSSLRDRNLALALVGVGLESQSPDEVIRGFRLLSHLEESFPEDSDLLTSLGVVLLKGKQPGEALKRFERVIALKPAYPPYRLNLARALLTAHRQQDARHELEEALALDPLFHPAIDLLSEIYRAEGETGKAEKLEATYDAAMAIHHN